jgi:hypothetical protein
MHDFRRRPEDLTAEQTQALEDLFEKVPALGVIYHLRWLVHHVARSRSLHETVVMLTVERPPVPVVACPSIRWSRSARSFACERSG